MNICFDGIGDMVATFAVEKGAELAMGDAVAAVDNATVGLGADGGLPCGVVVSVEEDGCAAVQVGGFACVKYSGTAPAAGWANLCVDGTGKVKVTSGSGIHVLVAAVDTAAMTAVIKL